jgi:hypothetical protein
VLAPGAELAGQLAAVTAAAGVAGVTGDGGAVLGSLGDQEVLGVIAAGGRMAAWAGWVQMIGLAEFARRRPRAMSATRAAREAAEEIGWKTGETWSRMMDQLARAVTLAGRLPRTLEAMRQGRVSDYKARIIEAQTAELSEEDVARADVVLAAAGQVKNPAGLRDFARRLVVRLDPAAAGRRKERARQDGYVRVFEEDSGNAGLSARQLPAADAVIAWQNIERRALDLHAAGAEGSAGQLQVQAVLDFLLGRATPGRPEQPHPDAGAGGEGACQDTRDAQEGAHSGTHPDAAEGAHQDAHPDPDQGAGRDAHPGRDASACHGTHPDAQEGAYSGTRGDAGEGACQDAHPGRDAGACQDAHRGGRGGGRGGWAVNPVLLVPWDPSLGVPSGPAELPGFGLLDQDDTLDLLRAAAGNAATRWCLTVLGRDGTAIAHGCAPGRRTLDAFTGAGTAAGLAVRLGVRLTPIAAGACQHAHAEPGYVPSRRLRYLIAARDTRCAAPGCGRPAAACDLDHTLAWEDGGLTCECNIAPLCMLHHQIKQAHGWELEQPMPGVLVWTSPSGLTRTTTPASRHT